MCEGWVMEARCARGSVCVCVCGCGRTVDVGREDGALRAAGRVRACACRRGGRRGGRSSGRVAAFGLRQVCVRQRAQQAHRVEQPLHVHRACVSYDARSYDSGQGVSQRACALFLWARGAVAPRVPGGAARCVASRATVSAAAVHGRAARAHRPRARCGASRCSACAAGTRTPRRHRPAAQCVRRQPASERKKASAR
jgi:hypothetical protein